MKGIEIEGRSVEEAIQEGLKKLQLEYKDVDIKILDEGKAGLFGLMGASPARVKISQKEPKKEKFVTPPNEKESKQTLEKILSFMGINSKVESRIQEQNVYLNIKTPEDKALLIGKNGQTLDALQLLINLIVGKTYQQKIVLDIEDYRARQEEKLINLAKTYAAEVKKTGKKKTIIPLPPHKRRIIHSTLNSDPSVQTLSEGKGIYRRITISPKTNDRV